VTGYLERGNFPAVIAVGGYTPDTIFTNADLAEFHPSIGLTPGQIEEKTGIQERPIAPADMEPSEMGTIAVKRALANANITKNPRTGLYEVVNDLLVSTITRDKNMETPGPAAEVHRRVGLPSSCSAEDLGAACAGMVYALRGASNQTQVNDVTTVAVGLGKMSPITNYDKRNTGVIFADGASALVVENRPDVIRPQFAFHTESDIEAVYAPAGGTIEMNGRLVTELAKRILPPLALRVAKEANCIDEHTGLIDWNTVTYVVPHPGSGPLILDVAAAAQIPKEKLVLSLHKHGNTSAASIGLALEDAVKENKFDRNKPIVALFLAIGAGMVAGAGIMEVKLEPAGASGSS